jgi:hypothetical protein
MGGLFYQFEYITAPIFPNVVVSVVNIGQSQDLALITLEANEAETAPPLPSDIELGPLEIFSFSFTVVPGRTTEGQAVSVKVTSDQVLPMVTSSDRNGGVTYLPGDFAVYSLSQTGARTRLW